MPRLVPCTSRGLRVLARDRTLAAFLTAILALVIHLARSKVDAPALVAAEGPDADLA